MYMILKGYGFLSFTKSISKNIGKNISKILISKYSQYITSYHVKQSLADENYFKKSNSRNS